MLYASENSVITRRVVTEVQVPVPPMNLVFGSVLAYLAHILVRGVAVALWTQAPYPSPKSGDHWCVWSFWPFLFVCHVRVIKDACVQLRVYGIAKPTPHTLVRYPPCEERSGASGNGIQ